ncbi:MAG: hypothetical protein IKY79_03235 [Bacteroidales bacterium]|nr:hypothetical protein [Bacteroidales bacterium]
MPIQVVIFIITLLRKKWKTAIGVFIGGFINAVCFCAWLFFTLIMSLFSPENDPFGKEHPIPIDLECNIPLANELIDFEKYEYSYEEATIDTLNSDTWLQIWDGSQGGIYEYDFYHPQLANGTVYLRCYEVTENIALSDKEVKNNSEVAVTSHRHFEKLADKQEFTIYEGDWEDYYAVRVEVWHHDNATGKERKLMQKIYRMEGWMR